MISEATVPGKACLPVSISKSTTPRAQRSARWSTWRPRACSGLMYAAVPMITPAPVMAAVMVGECSRFRSAGASS